MNRLSVSFLSFVAGATLIVALTGGPAPARAQTSPLPATDVPARDFTVSPASPARKTGLSRFGINFGSFKPTGGRNFADDTNHWAMVGLTYRLQASGKRTPLQPDLYMDYAHTYDFGSGGTYVAFASPLTTVTSARVGRGFWGVGVSERGVASIGQGQFTAFAGAGAGIYRLETVQRGYYTTLYGSVFRTDDQNPRHTFRPGGKLSAGLSHQSGLFAEAAFHNIGDVDNRPFRGLTVTVGFRH